MNGMEKQLRYEEFNDEEQELIDETIEVLRQRREYGTKTLFYHDMVLLGCKSILTDKAKV